MRCTPRALACICPHAVRPRLLLIPLARRDVRPAVKRRRSRRLRECDAVPRRLCERACTRLDRPDARSARLLAVAFV